MSDKILAALIDARRWHQGDDWRDGSSIKRSAWEAHLSVLDAAIAQVKQRQEAREGWRLVPVEPTTEMIARAYSEQGEATLPAIETIYRAMLAAAPQPEEPKQQAPGLYLDSGEFIPAEELNKERNKE